VYDIGGDPHQARQYYNAALQNGADLVIGPLGKEYANFLSGAQRGEYDDGSYTKNSFRRADSRPLILLGGDHPLRNGVNRFTLSPERDARIVADRAFANGYVNAALLVPLTTNGQRSADAFTRYWLANGGKLSKSIRYSPKQFDHSTELKQLFDINQSEYRHNRLSQTLGYKPKYASYRRSDIDFVFMIADNNAGRIVRPQINFFGGSDIPVLSSSSIFNGIQDPTNNIDLDRTSFPVMPWVLIAQDVAPYAGQLNMLFALGADAYNLAANLTELRSDPYLSMQGHTGMLSIERSGEVIGQPIWARFSQGVAQTQIELEYLTPPAQDDTSLPAGLNGQPQGVPSYDESNWDPRQSRRRSGT
jgi:outer membrane PBP1 activator LpoA protein